MVPRPPNSSPVADIPQISFAERIMKSLKLRRNDRAGGGTVAPPPYVPAEVRPPPTTTGAPVVQSSRNQRTVLPPSSQLVSQPRHLYHVALPPTTSDSGSSTDTAQISYNNPRKSSAPLGPHGSNSPALYNTPFVPAPNTPSNTRDCAHNYNLNKARYTGIRQSRVDEKSGQGQGGQPSLASLGPDSTFMQYPGSPMPVGSPPGVFSPHNQGTVTSHLLQMVPQPQRRPNVAPPLAASNSGRGTDTGKSSVPLGPQVSNSPSVHNSPFTPASPTRQPRQEVDSRAAGSTVPPIYVPLPPQPSLANRNTVGHVSSQLYGTASGSTSSMSNTQPRHNFSRCILPGCDKQAIFDYSIHEQREYCEKHIKHAVFVGFAGICLTCQKMPARHDSEFCSEACKNSPAATSSTPVYTQSTAQHAGWQVVKPSSQPPMQSNVRQPTVTEQPASAKLCESCGSPRVAQGKRSCSECAAADNPTKKPPGSIQFPRA